MFRGKEWQTAGRTVCATKQFRAIFILSSKANQIKEHISRPWGGCLLHHDMMFSVFVKLMLFLLFLCPLPSSLPTFIPGGL